MKDYYDLWFLSTEYPFVGNLLANAVRATFDRRETALPHEVPAGLSDHFATDAAKVAQWVAFLRRARLRKEAPPLDLLVVSLRGFLMPVVNAAGAASAIDTVWRPGGPWEVR